MARFVLSFAVAVLVLLVVWVAVRAVGPASSAVREPTVVLPPSPSSLLSPSPSPSLSPVRSPSPSLSAARSPSPSRSSARSKRTSSAPSAAVRASADLRVSSSWGEGYVAGVRVENTGRTPLEWRVTVRHDSDDDLRLRGTWNADGTQDGDRLVFRGGTLQPGASVTFGYQTADEGRRNARPIGCSVVGGTCTMS